MTGFHYALFIVAVTFGYVISFRSLSSVQYLQRKTALRASPVNIATYNVLSSKLSDTETFSQCKPEHLFAPVRLVLLKKKLQSEISKRSIICMQEVSNEWAGELHGLFSRQGYHLLTGLYGNKADGYMGVAMAVPLDKYEVADSDVRKIGDSKREKRTNEPESTGFWSKIGKTMKAAKNIWSSGQQETKEGLLWESVKKRDNQMLCVKLVDKTTSESFVVGTYHMPCAYTNPELMVVHCALSAQQIERFSSGLPFVYAGDFNCKPFSTMYSMLTTGCLDPSHPEYPNLAKDETWRPTLKRPLTSAYHSPTLTDSRMPNYIETYDYIFHSPEWRTEKVGPLPLRGVWRAPVPNAEEPSNHCLLTASLTLTDNRAQFPDDDW